MGLAGPAEIRGILERAGGAGAIKKAAREGAKFWSKYQAATRSGHRHGGGHRAEHSQFDIQ